MDFFAGDRQEGKVNQPKHLSRNLRDAGLGRNKAIPMIEGKVNKHDLRTKETRELLLQAAKDVFVRDGYEGAELGEIAALAGRTKGAIYAQFKSKEDIFLALVEERAHCYRARMERLLA